MPCCLTICQMKNRPRAKDAVERNSTSVIRLANQKTSEKKVVKRSERNARRVETARKEQEEEKDAEVVENQIPTVTGQEARKAARSSRNPSLNPKMMASARSRRAGSCRKLPFRPVNLTVTMANSKLPVVKTAMSEKLLAEREGSHPVQNSRVGLARRAALVQNPEALQDQDRGQKAVLDLDRVQRVVPGPVPDQRVDHVHGLLLDHVRDHRVVRGRGPTVDQGQGLKAGPDRGRGPRVVQDQGLLQGRGPNPEVHLGRGQGVRQDLVIRRASLGHLRKVCLGLLQEVNRDQHRGALQGHDPDQQASKCVVWFRYAVRLVM